MKVMIEREVVNCQMTNNLTYTTYYPRKTDQFN